MNSLFYRGWFCRQVQAHRVYSNWFLLDFDRSQRDMEIWRNYQCPWAVGIGVWVQILGHYALLVGCIWRVRPSDSISSQLHTRCETGLSVEHE